MLKNPLTNEHLIISDLVKQNNTVFFNIKTDQHAQGYTSTEQASGFQIPDEIWNQVLNLVEDYLPTLPRFAGWQKISSWANWEHDYPFRLFINSDDASILTARYFELVKPLFEGIVNPKVEIWENGKLIGFRIYVNQIDPTARPILDQYPNILIETKPA